MCRTKTESQEISEKNHSCEEASEFIRKQPNIEPKYVVDSGSSNNADGGIQKKHLKCVESSCLKPLSRRPPNWHVTSSSGPKPDLLKILPFSSLFKF